MTDVKDFREQEITFLFDIAKEEIDKINQPADEKKKVIVIKLAEQLEKVITQTDTISSLIVKRLTGKVSPSLIRECLPERYKQRIRVDNAKQKKIQKEFNNLAPLPLLNQDVAISDDSSPLKSQSINQTTSKSQEKEKEEEIEQQQQKKPSQLETNIKDKLVTIEENKSSYDNNSNKDILPFEFSIGRTDIQNYLDTVKSNTEDKVWFNGIIDINTQIVISSSLGRLYQQNITEEKSNNSIASATEYTNKGI